MSKIFSTKAGSKLDAELQGTVIVTGKLTKIEGSVATIAYEEWDVQTQKSAKKDYVVSIPDSDVKVGDVVTAVCYTERGKGNVAEKIMNNGIYTVNNPTTGKPVLQVIMGIANRKSERSGDGYVSVPLVFPAKDIPEKTVTSKANGKVYKFPAHQEFGVYLKHDQSGKLTDVVKFVDYVGDGKNDHAAQKAAERYDKLSKATAKGDYPILSSVITAIVDIRREADQVPYEKVSTYRDNEQKTRYWSGKVRSIDYSWGDTPLENIFEKVQFNRTPDTQTQSGTETSTETAASQDSAVNDFLNIPDGLVEELPFA